jgi:hypothetical protein
MNMGSEHLVLFDVAEALGADYLGGDIHGNDAFELITNAISHGGANKVWNLLWPSNWGFEYKFVGASLGPLLDEYGKRLPSNTVIVVSGRPRSRLLSGLAWQKGDFKMPREDEAGTVISGKQRFCVFAPNSIHSQAGELEYIGTTQGELQQLLSFLEKRGCSVSAQEIHQALNWGIEEVVHRLDELEKRRQIFFSGDGMGTLYTSILTILNKGKT